ncbi:MAG: hypothetical protein WBV36_11200 [Terriglobales bacterium]
MKVLPSLGEVNRNCQDGVTRFARHTTRSACIFMQRLIPAVMHVLINLRLPLE